MANVYKTNFVVTGATSGPTEQIALENPANSGKLARVYIPLSAVADQSFVIWQIKRYPGLPVHGEDASEPVAKPVYKNDSASPNPSCSVFVGPPSTSLDFSALTFDWWDTVSLDPSDAGDDMERLPAKYLPENHALVVRPGECMSITVPEGVVDYTVIMVWEEETVT